MRISPCPTLIRPRASPTTTFLPLAPRHMEKSSLFWLSGSCGGCLASPQRSSPVAASHTFTAQAVVVVVRRRKTENKKGGGMLVYKVKVALQYYFTSPPVYLSRYIYIYIYIYISHPGRDEPQSWYVSLSTTGDTSKCT